MKLTIFTPTYNRLNEIRGLYDSIVDAVGNIDKNDTVQWLVVDDGSQEKYQEEIDFLNKKSIFDIKYYKQKNSGKHVAFNYAIKNTTGDLLVCIDDDDRLTNNSLKEIFSTAKQLITNYKDCVFGGFVGRAIDCTDNFIEKRNINLPIISNTIEIRDKYGYAGEPEVYFLDILKQFQFDVFNNEKFLTEAYLFDRLSSKYPLYYTNNKWIIKKYLKNGLSDRNLIIRIESPCGAESYYFQRKNMSIKFFNKLKSTINRQRFSFYVKNKRKNGFDIYELLAIPFSFFIHIIDMCKYTKI